MIAASRRTVLAGAAAALAVTACSPSVPSASEAAGSDATDASGVTTVTFRLWDEAAAPAYKESFDAFAAEHPDIRVEVEVVPWANYWDRLDPSSDEMADIFWTNASDFARHADNGDLIDITAAIGDEHDEWEEFVVDLYTRDDALWGVPQLWHSIALFYNEELAGEAAIEPATLTWAPPTEGSSEPVGADDTLLAAARALTTDAAGVRAGEAGFDPASIETFGFNAPADLQVLCASFLAQNGAQLQDDGEFAFATEEGAETFQYLTDLVNVHRVSPPAVDPDADGGVSRDLFLQGRLGLFQSGTDNLRTIADEAGFEWGVAPMVAGPEGRTGVAHAVAAAGNAHTPHEDATVAVLRWLGSADGQAALAGRGVAFPAVLDAQDTFVDYWAQRDVDIEVLREAAREPSIPAPVGPDVSAGTAALTPVLQDMFRGAIPVPEALQRAQAAGNGALNE